MESLPEEQYDFVIRGIVDEGWTPRDAEREFAIRFPGEKLPKSNVDRWWKAVGKELAERYRLRRYQIRVVKEQLEADGIDIKAGAYKAIINNVEDHLLTSERDLISADPVKLLGLRQEDERLKIKREQIELNREKLVLERQKLLGMATDPVKQGTEFMTELLDYLKDDGEGVLFIKKHVRPFIDFLTNKYAEGEA